MKKKMLESLYGFVYADSLATGCWGERSSLLLAGLDSFSYLSAYSLMKNLDRAWRHGAYTCKDQPCDFDPVLVKALEGFERGVHPMECGMRGRIHNSPSALMRAWPLSIYALKVFNLKRDQEEAEVFVRRYLSTSHAHETSLWLASLYSRLLWDLLEKPKTKPLLEALKELEGFEGAGEDLVELMKDSLKALIRAESFEEALKLAGSNRDVQVIVGSLASLIFQDRPEDFYHIYKLKEIRGLALGAWLSIR